MLDSETKRRIDTARDILVGKVPDPKSQVEQITIALIYKFMDDMDAQAEELGGKRKFFTGDFARFGWAKFMRGGLSGHEALNVYAEAITRMPENPGVPPLFREIFKNAFLPYRDPETLRAFLKVIDEFEYDHSERLGDAFEYLLSVLGSQGQAGQFRTPRHIIDFIVSVVDPKKNESVLDPACGTAGFMISAYKHILRTNSTANTNPPRQQGNNQSTNPPRQQGNEPASSLTHRVSANTNPPRQQGEHSAPPESALHTSKIPAAKGDKLTPDERKKLAGNFSGYDISPDMVRLSLVNMYLHGFTDPHVYEYDTLTSQDRWNEMADVILANPPFMSPKGGIKPHNRFSVQSKRSEVLFVDYMAEHLTPAGRAGIIVPEGIIFQSQTAYKALRKMLVEQYLVAVVSLPAGVFNPYSGVKTSILILDKSLAKQSDTVGFFKVENDGFNLGAQRRPIDKNDLPQVLAEVNEYLRRLRTKEPTLADASGYSTAPSLADASGSSTNPTRQRGHGLIVAKEKIAANGEYNLSGERYRIGGDKATTFPRVPLASVCTLMTDGDWVESKDQSPSGIRLVQTGNVGIGEYLDKPDNARFISEETFTRLQCIEIFPGDVLISRLPDPVGRACILPRLEGRAITAVDCSILRFDPEKFISRLFPYYTKSEAYYAQLAGYLTGSSRSRISRGNLETIEIPLPPLEVQKEIVAEIEGYQRVIDGARAVLDHYRPHIPIQPDWPMGTFADACAEIKTGPFGSLLHQTDYVADGVPVVNPQDIVDGEIVTDKVKYVSPDTRDRLSEFSIKGRDIVIGRRGEMGRCAIATDEMDGWLCGTGCCVIRPSDSCDVRYLALHLQSPSSIAFLDQHSVGVTIKNLNHRILADLPIPLPPLPVQRSLVSEIEAERRLVEANRELIARMETKIAATLGRIWGEEKGSAPP